MVLHKGLNKVDRQLLLDDIEGAKPRPKIFKTTRVVDPLTPVYQLPTVKLAPPVQTKFIRDSHDNSDLEGAHPRPLFRFQVGASLHVSPRAWGAGRAGDDAWGAL
jgi:hypothetical protein